MKRPHEGKGWVGEVKDVVDLMEESERNLLEEPDLINYKYVKEEE
jgi:hypothetical protein